MSEWYDDDPRRSLPRMPFYVDWGEEERKVVADRKEDVTLLISDARAWERKHGYVPLVGTECSGTLTQPTVAWNTLNTLNT